jgi:hypothetical protein
MPPIENRLTKLTKSAVRQARTHMLWVHYRAEGRAHPDDTFVHVRWKRQDET